MTDEEKKQLSSFETKLRTLIFMQEQLQKENKELKRLLEEVNQEKDQMAADYNQLRIGYTDLKSAIALGENGGDAKEAKRRIDKLVREIDLCIAQLE